ncbi:signal transduction histidine kinase [Thermocatellispora tengchongensis]|uniref:histidine kinase n=1 Tax=Thermocatellispora tengchongensis TaxID=1073253 RepID=A0A840P5X4_9ACTN|nr:histidine kinase [Thermocatellispora tengchongensis]MBB5135068.1 signal transduction histidine kinase [Thermocatellispora tengchongensis]
MIARWVHNVLQPGHGPARVGVMLAALVGDLLFVETGAGAAGWAFALAAFGLGLLFGLWSPLAAVLVQAGMLALMDVLGLGVVVAIKVMTCVTLFDLAVRRPGRSFAAGAVAVALVMCFNLFGALPAELPSVLFRVAIVVGVPFLLGGYVRMMSEAAERERERVAQRIVASRTAERAAIARELHDLVAHHVSSMVLRVGVARHVLPRDDPRVTATLDDLHASGTAALADLRKLVAILRDPARVGDDPAASIVDPGTLPAALDAVMERGRGNGLDVRAAIDPAVAGLDALRGIAVLRLAQEGLANVAKHAGPAARVWVGVTVGDDRSVHLDIADDGSRGAPGQTAPPGQTAQAGQRRQPGHGLVGMRERVDLLGGHLEVGPAGPGGAGWRLSAMLPEPAA